MAKNVAKAADGKNSVREEEISEDEIARRAHEISRAQGAGTNDENWFRAERELRAGRSGQGPEESSTDT